MSPSKGPETTPESRTPEVRVVRAEDTYTLRQRVLRPGKPLSSCAFEGDELSTTLHFGAFLADELVGIASIYDEHETPESARSGARAFRLRGMATSPEVRGLGAGKALVDACKLHIERTGGGSFWCNARTSAAGFYERLGFTIDGEPFELSGIGPHVRMRVALSKRD